MNARAAVDESDAGAGPPQFERTNGGGIFRADHQDVVIEIGMGFLVVVDDLGEAFAGHVEAVGHVIVAHRENDLLRIEALRAAARIDGVRDEGAVFAGDFFDRRVLTDVDLVMHRHAPIILEGFVTHGLFVERRHGNIADFKQFRRGEKHHIGGVIVERVDDAALVEENDVYATALEFDAAGEAGGAGADHDDIVCNDIMHG